MIRKNPHYEARIEVNLSDILTSILISKDKKKEEPKEFVVKMNDSVPGIYTNSILNVIKKNTNIDEEVLETNDYLVFKKNGDIDITDDYTEIYNYKLFYLIQDYSKVESAIEAFFKNNKKEVKCPLLNICPDHNNFHGCNICEHSRNQQSNKKVETKKDFCSNNKKIYDGQFVTAKEKVRIFYNFVKIGYDTYDITTIGNEEYVNIEGDLYTVNTNFLGQDFIQKV